MVLRAVRPASPWRRSRLPRLRHHPPRRRDPLRSPRRS